MIAGRARAWLRAHPGVSGWAVVLGLHLSGLALGLAAAGFSLAALLQGGEDPLADEAASETDTAALSSLLGGGAGSVADETAAIEAVGGAAETPAGTWTGSGSASTPAR